MDLGNFGAGLSTTSDGKLRININTNSLPAGVPAMGGTTRDNSEALRAQLENGSGQLLPIVFFSGQNPTNPTGAAGDWALLKTLMDQVAYKAAIVLMPGFIRVDSKVKTPSGTVIIGQPGVTLVQTLPNDGDFQSAAFAATVGTAIGAATTLSAAVKRGSASIATVVGLHVGDIIVISNALGAGNSAGLRVSCHVVKEVAGVNANLDRPVPRDYAAGDFVQVVQSIPQDIIIEGNGMLMTGTGVRYVTLAFAKDCTIGGIRVNDSQGICSDLMFSFDVGGFHNYYHDMLIDANRLFSSVAGIALESNDHSRGERLEVDRSGGIGLIMYDSADCNYHDVSAGFCEAQGICLTSDTAVHSATTQGCVECSVTGSSSSQGNGQGGVTLAGVLIDQGSSNCFAMIDVAGTLGIGWKVGDGTTICSANEIRGCANNNGTIGVFINVGADNTHIGGVFDISGNGTSNVTGIGIDTRDDLTFDVIFSSGGNCLQIIDKAGGAMVGERIDVATDPGAAIFCILSSSGYFAVDHMRVNMGTSCTAFNMLAGNATLPDARVALLHAPSGVEIGLICSGGEMFVGRASDLDSVPTAIFKQGSGVISVEQCGSRQKTLTNADITLLFSDAQRSSLDFIGAFAADRTAIMPASVSSAPGMSWKVSNNSSAAHNLKIEDSGAAGVITVAQTRVAITQINPAGAMARVTADSLET